MGKLVFLSLDSQGTTTQFSVSLTIIAKIIKLSFSLIFMKKMTEEEEILNDKDMMEQLKESEKNRKKGKTWEFKY